MEFKNTKAKKPDTLAQIVKIPIKLYSTEIKLGKMDEELLKLQEQTREIKNKTIQLAWEWHNFARDYNNDSGVIPKFVDKTGYKTPDGYFYNVLSQKYNNWYSQNLSSIIRDTYNKFKSDFNEILNGQKSIASFKEEQPIELKNDAIKIRSADNTYIFTLSLFSRKYKEEINLSTVSVDFTFRNVKRDSDEKRITSILDKCISGEYGIGGSKIVLADTTKIKKLKDDVEKKEKSKYTKNDYEYITKYSWELFLCYKIDRASLNKTILDSNKIMGIDLGWVRPATMAYNFPEKCDYIENMELFQHARELDKRKKSIQHQAQWCADGRVGHGIKTRLKPLEHIGNKKSNFVDLLNHRYSRYIVNEAIKHGCGKIQMEDLTGIKNKKKNSYLGDWTYFDLQSKITYKAKSVGIEVVKISPKYTSQRCNKCGYISADSRPNQETFCCVKCGYKNNADNNAALNIATLNIEDVIKKQLEAQSQK